MTAVLGVDLGGTRLRAVLREDGRRRRIVRTRPETGVLPAALRAIAGPRKLDGLVIGARGIWTKPERDALARRLAPLARKIIVLPDIELAWRSALGGAAGVVVVAGTGAIAYARSSDGRAARAGGLGPLIGDEGSSFWIGKQWLKTRPEDQQRKAAVRPDAVRAIAALAPKALRERPRLAAQAGAQLAALARTAAAGAGLRGKVPLSWQGGLFSHTGLRDSFLRALPRRFQPRAPLETPDETAAKLLR